MFRNLQIEWMKIKNYRSIPIWVLCSNDIVIIIYVFTGYISS